MNADPILDRIEINPKILIGKPVIRGTRLSVEYILGLLAKGVTLEELIQEYPGLSPEDVQACLLFATRTLQNTLFMPLQNKVE